MKKDVQLKNVKPYQDEYGHWFLKLVYTYEDEDGAHEFTYPKVDLPFSQERIPYHFTTPTDDDLFIELKSYPTFSGNSSYGIVYNGVVIDPRTNEKLGPCISADILIKPKIHEMTLEEVEKKLGYKVKIVSNKDTK